MSRGVRLSCDVCTDNRPARWCLRALVHMQDLLHVQAKAREGRHLGHWHRAVDGHNWLPGEVPRARCTPMCAHVCLCATTFVHIRLNNPGALQLLSAACTHRALLAHIVRTSQCLHVRMCMRAHIFLQVCLCLWEGAGKSLSRRCMRMDTLGVGILGVCWMHGFACLLEE